MKAIHHLTKRLLSKAVIFVWSNASGKMLLTSILLLQILFASFGQQKNVLLSRFDSCHVHPPEQAPVAIQALSVGAPMVRVAYVIPSNRAPQPNGVANLQHAIKLGQQFFKEQMEQNGFGPKTFIFETEDDGVTPLIHVVHVAETDEYLRGDLWARAQTAATNAGISLWAPGEVWVVIPETHVMFPDGSGAGGVALGAGYGSGDGGGVSMIGSNALPLFNPAMITDDTPYDGKVLPELGPYPMKQDMTFNWFEGTTLSSVGSSWLGALWHETGHAFGLGHDFRNDSNFRGNLMGNGLRGTRGYLFPEKYPEDYTRLEYVAALSLNVSHFFNRDKTGICCPTVSATSPPSVTPQQGLVHISFQASDPDGLSFAYLIEVLDGDLAGEMLLDGTNAEATFAVPYFRPGETNIYNIFVLDKQGHKAGVGVQFNVPAGYNQAPHPHIRITPPVPTLDQPITLDATLSWDAEHNLSSILSTWDVNNDGRFDTEPSTNKIVPYTYASPGNYLVRLKMTDPAGGETISTPVSVRIPGEGNIVCQTDTLSSQAEVNAFSCTEIDGSLFISGNDITNLSTLASLRKVGNLRISNNPNLVTFDLPALETVGSLSIFDNDALTSISGVNELVRAGSFYIRNNPKLGSISGFNSLTQVDVGIGGPAFVIEQNDALTHLQGFKALKTTPNLRIVDNPKLLALDGFPSLTEVIGDLQISNNASLETINGFNKLTVITGYPKIIFNSALLIQNNASLETLAGLSSLRAIEGLLDNGQFPPVQGMVTVNVTGNPKLTDCCSLGPMLDALGSDGAIPPWVHINISENGVGCTLKNISKCETCEGDVTLTSQMEVDAFGCSRVTGNLTVTGTDITNLNGLSSLTKVYGNLRIENVNVTDLNNLSLVDSIGGALLVLNNPKLNHIQSLSFSTAEGIEISSNDNLLWIEGFNRLHKLNWLNVRSNAKLTRIVGLNSIEAIQATSATIFAPGGMVISNNDNLRKIEGFQMLSRVQSITITDNNALPSLDGFSKVSQIDGQLSISYNGSLKVINAFEKLTSIVGTTRHIPNGALYIVNNPLLEGFPGLSSLKEIRSEQFAEISINNNTSLKNIDGLSSLTTFFALNADKTLNIRNNDVLENVDGLSSLVNAPPGMGDTYVNVTKNPKLRRCCELQPLLEVLSSYEQSSLHIDISQNGGGCTLQDILACSSQKILDFTLINFKTHKVVQNFQNESTIDLADPNLFHLLLQANTAPQTIGSVEFILDGHIRYIENYFPYQFNLPQLSPGKHTVRVEVYSKHQKKGEKGIGRTATIHVINSAIITSVDVVNRYGQTLLHISDGDKINVNDPAFKHFLFRANTVPGRVGKVEFNLNNRLVAVEYGFPYEINKISSPGDYTLEAIPYIKTKNQQYLRGTPLKISFKIVSENSTSSSQLASNGQQYPESLQQANEDVSVVIFPVPVDNELFLTMDDSLGKDAMVTIRTTQGQSVYKGTYSELTSISTTDFKPGVYVLQIACNNGFHKLVKFIKK